MKKFIFFVLLLSCLYILAIIDSVLALPVFPGASGFGSTTSAGRGGKVYRVTNLNDFGPGSLRAAVEALGPRVVIFEVSGTISMHRNLTISNPFITIAGQTAPFPGITLKGRSLVVRNTHDVLIQHIRVRVGDQFVSNLDGISVTRSSYNVVIDHCSVSWAIDENINAVFGAHDVTISNCISSEALYDSVHSEGPHSKGFMVARAKNISIIRNLIAHNYDRNIQFGKSDKGFSAVFVNNVIYNWGSTATRISRAGLNKYVSIAGNSYLAGPNTKSGKMPILVYAEANPKVYLQKNMFNGQLPDNPWDIARIIGEGFDPKVLSSPPVWPEGLVLRDVTKIKDEILSNSGARPAERDPVDSRIVTDVRMGTGKIIDSQAEVGGWPRLSENIRRLELPDNPNDDKDGDGYTNLEEWLHAMAVEVEGKKRPSLSKK